MTSIALVITITATVRRRPRAPTRRITGHVATTIIVAHTVASRNGRSTHSDAAIRIAISRTDSSIRVRSRGARIGRASNASARRRTGVGLRREWPVVDRNLRRQHAHRAEVAAEREMEVHALHALLTHRAKLRRARGVQRELLLEDAAQVARPDVVEHVGE